MKLFAYPPQKNQGVHSLCFLTGDFWLKVHKVLTMSVCSVLRCVFSRHTPSHPKPWEFSAQIQLTSHLSESNIRKTVKYTFDNWCKEWIYSLIWHKSASAFMGRNVSFVISQQQLHILDTFIFGSLSSAHAWTHVKFPTRDTSSLPLRNEFMRPPLYSI